MRILTFALCLLCFSVSAQIDWDFPYNPDSDNDGYIYSEDLLDLLAIYGQEYSSDELYLSQDSSSLIVYVGELIPQKCSASCSQLEGNWNVIDWKGINNHYENLALYDLDIVDADYFPYLWINPSGDDNSPFSLILRNRNVRYHTGNGIVEGGEIGAFQSSYNPNSNWGYDYECWCVTHQRPRVEYKVILFDGNDLNIEPLISEAALEGWRLMPAAHGAGDKATMWRWAE